jgi:hypothetical protein
MKAMKRGETFAETAQFLLLKTRLTGFIGDTRGAHLSNAHDAIFLMFTHVLIA